MCVSEEDEHRKGGEGQARKTKKTRKDEKKTRKKKKTRRKKNSLPLTNQLLVMFSWLTTRILLLGSACSRCLARSMHTSELEQPMPAIE